MQEWRFRFLSDAEIKKSKNIKNGTSTGIGSGVNEKAAKVAENKEGFADAFTKKGKEDLIMNMAISPLSTATGGIASPVYAAGKQIISGAAVGAVAGDLVATVAVMALQKGIEMIQQRLADLEAKSESMNNADNALIRAGSVNSATFYGYDIWGINEKTDRS